MEIKDLVGQVEALGGQVKEAVSQAEQKINANVDEKIESVKSDIAAKVTKDEFDGLKEKVKEMSAKSRTSGMFGGAEKSFGDELGEKLEAKITADKDAMRSKRPFTLQMEAKAVGDVQASNFTTNVTSSFIAPQVRPGIIMSPIEPVRLRNLLSVISTSSPKITYARENGGEGAPGMVAPGELKPQMDFDLTVEEADVRKIAGHIRVHEEMLEDIAFLQSYLVRKGTEKLLDLEDSQILNGDGTGQNLEGLFTAATAFDFPEGYTVTAANRYDALRAVRLQARRANRTISYILVSPLDYFLMTVTKDSNNNYILQGGGNGLLPNIDGIPVFEHTKIPDGSFLAVDRNAVDLAFRKGMEVRFFDQDRDNAIRNMVTIVIEERLALPIYEPAGLIKGTFTDALTDLGAAS